MSMARSDGSYSPGKEASIGLLGQCLPWVILQMRWSQWQAGQVACPSGSPQAWEKGDPRLAGGLLWESIISACKVFALGFICSNSLSPNSPQTRQSPVGCCTPSPARRQAWDAALLVQGRYWLLVQGSSLPPYYPPRQASTEAAAMKTGDGTQSAPGQLVAMGLSADG